MSTQKRRDEKSDRLQEDGAWNPRPERVADALFRVGEFFDPRDLVQVKYEMLRRVRVDGRSVKDSATEFGFSRPSFYEARAALERAGLAGLLPRKRGPRSGHKLTAEVLAFLQESRAKDRFVRASELARRASERFGVSVHPRSIERALARVEKKSR